MRRMRVQALHLPTAADTTGASMSCPQGGDHNPMPMRDESGRIVVKCTKCQTILTA